MNTSLLVGIVLLWIFWLLYVVGHLGSKYIVDDLITIYEKIAAFGWFWVNIGLTLFVITL